MNNLNFEKRLGRYYFTILDILPSRFFNDDKCIIIVYYYGTLTPYRESRDHSIWANFDVTFVGYCSSTALNSADT